MPSANLSAAYCIGPGVRNWCLYGFKILLSSTWHPGYDLIVIKQLLVILAVDITLGCSV